MRVVGTILFWCAWPLLWFVMPLTRRVRVIIIDDDKVLVVKNWIGPNKWDLPGGGIKRGESAEEAAKREIFEELHLIVNETSLVNAEEEIRSFCGLTMRVTFVQAKIESLDTMQKNWEIIDTQWLKPSDIKVLLTSE